ncbi:COG2958 family protein [Vibrio splendidus]|uniref:COG2958 family protein n=1 Tax=Vibrio splendidus TaxID=29497 RepID=UPI000C82BE23|nr:HrgA protein [Vibrio splendidus]PMO90283.1 HrgA protein [Vibrio splendidus]PMP33851.1 HrgA protein [Vibrio splendidus]PMP46683.1 HrgA protein [Vibrio splendidus]PMP58993.1 HrgA protein [Vibrio splendidus]
MSKLSQSKKIALFLQDNPNQRYTAKTIAEAITTRYPEDYAEKRANPRFETEQDFISQVVAEIGAQKQGILNQSNKIKWQDKPRPRVYWFDDGTLLANDESLPEEESSDEAPINNTLSEYDLYPILMDYLKSEHQLYCLRIDEKRSKNNLGSGGNQWLHPDIVAMEPVAQQWHQYVKSCVLQGGGQSVRLWSFEVKKTLTMGNVRKCFFQAVSNSSWASEGYLVATSIADSRVEQELRMLSALHGIGVILLSVNNPSESELLLPAKKRPEIDWQSVNRIVEENADFKDFIDLVSNYYQTGRVRSKDWNH